MSYSYAVYTGNGATTQFALTFPYIRKEHVYVSVNYVNQNYTWVNDSTVLLASAPANAARVEVRRITPVSAPLVDFADGSALVAADLDTNALQQTYINQEQDDNFEDTISINAQGELDAGNQRLTNLADPTLAQDAATKAYVDTADNLRLKRDGTQAMTGALNMGSQKITNLANGTVATDAVTKGQFDTGVASAAADAAAAAASAASAATSAGNASTSAGNASTSASNANTAKIAAQAAQTAAEAARDQTLATYDSFDDRYLGTKASNPTLDNDGNALVAGALYFNSVANEMRLYTGSAWVAAYVSGAASNIGFTPYGNIAAANVQAAVQELEDEKLAKAGGTVTGDVTLDNQSDLRFSEATGNGINWVAFQAPGSIAANVTWTLPATDATVAGHALKSNAAGVLSWGTAGGAAGGGTDDVFYENSSAVTVNYTISAGKNALSAGPITINAGVTVTVPSGSSWVVV